MSEPPLLEDALARLEARINWERRDRSAGWRVDLAPIRDLVSRAGHPARGRGVCHVAGSKGKGSVASLLAAGLSRSGRSVGVFGSPHVERIHERIRIGGQPIGDEALAAALGAALDVVADAEADGTAGGDASWFDIVTLAGLWAFQAAGVDWIVLEVGLGGRLDSTNVIDPPDVAVVTTIALEHTAILGGTLSEIAGEKGGIVKPGSLLVTGTPPGGEAHQVLSQIARDLGVEHVSAWSGEDQTFEEANVRVARAALELLGRGVPGLGGDSLAPETVVAARLPGRMEWFHSGATRVLMDGAHVPSSLEMALQEAQAAEPGPWGAVVAVHGEKSLSELLSPLARGGVVRLFATTVPGSGIHHPAAAVARAASELGLECEDFDTPAEALRAALGWSAEPESGGASEVRPALMVTGSLYLVGALRPVLAGGSVRS